MLQYWIGMMRVNGWANRFFRPHVGTSYINNRAERIDLVTLPGYYDVRGVKKM